MACSCVLFARYDAAVTRCGSGLASLLSAPWNELIGGLPMMRWASRALSVIRGDLMAIALMAAVGAGRLFFSSMSHIWVVLLRVPWRMSLLSMVICMCVSVRCASHPASHSCGSERIGFVLSPGTMYEVLANLFSFCRAGG